MKRYLTILAVATLGITGCTTKPVLDSKGSDILEQGQKSIAVETEKVAYSNINKELLYIGKVDSSASVSIASKIPGKIESANYEVGDYVTNGTTLMTIDSQSIYDQIKSLESQLAISQQAVISAQSAADSVTGGQYESQLQTLESAVTGAKSQIDINNLSITNAEITLKTTEDSFLNVTDSYNNTKILYDAGIVSKNDFDKAQQSYDAAEKAVSQANIAYDQSKLSNESALAGLKSAEDALTLSSGKLVDESIQKANLAIDQALVSKNAAQIQLDIAKASLSDTTVSSPMNGIIDLKSAKIGEFATTQAPSYTIINIDKVNVIVSVSEELINKLSIGQNINVIVKAAKEEPFSGKITSISPSADQTNTYPIQIEIDNSNHVLKPGMIAEMNFVRDEVANAIVVPRNTVLKEGSISYVFINTAGIATKTEVTTGIDNGIKIELLTGVKLGDEIIIKGQTYVIDGDKIDIVGGN